MDRGCQWEGTIGTLKQHTCEFTLVPCPKECKDRRNKVKHFMRRDLVKHLERDCPNRDYSCQYCGEKGTYNESAIHDMICEKKILPCSNAGCTQTMERQQITEHVRTQCPYTVISCKYKGIGCTSRLKRRDMAAHEKDDHLHLHMALDAVNTLQDTVNTLKSLSVTSKGSEFMTFEVPGYKEMVAVGVFTSPSFYTHPYGYHMAVTVHWGTALNLFQFKHVSLFMHVSARILEGAYDTALKWPFRGKVNIEVLNQLEDKNHIMRTCHITDGSVGSNVDAPQGIPHYELGHNSFKNTQYLVDDTLYFRVSVEVADHKPWLQCTAK